MGVSTSVRSMGKTRRNTLTAYSTHHTAHSTAHTHNPIRARTHTPTHRTHVRTHSTVGSQHSTAQHTAHSTQHTRTHTHTQHSTHTHTHTHLLGFGAGSRGMSRKLCHGPCKHVHVTHTARAERLGKRTRPYPGVATVPGARCRAPREDICLL